MKDFASHWERLAAGARQAPARDDVAAPYGFATRVAARAFSESATPTVLGVFRLFSVRALWMAGLLMLMSMAANYVAFASGEEDEQSVEDPVSDVLSAL
jgi:hypothetical protein